MSAGPNDAGLADTDQRHLGCDASEPVAVAGGGADDARHQGAVAVAVLRAVSGGDVVTTGDDRRQPRMWLHPVSITATR